MPDTLGDGSDDSVPLVPSWVSVRLPAAAAAIVVVGLGLGVRAVTGGVFAKYAGTALYAVLIYLLVVLVAVHMRPMVAGPVALGICWAVEFAQLTPVPAALSARNVLLRLVFGTSFTVADLWWYAIGATLAVAGHVAIRHLRKDR
jgi:hypothetical protein